MIECVLVCLVHKIVKIRREQLFQTLSLFCIQGVAKSEEEERRFKIVHARGFPWPTAKDDVMYN